MVADVGRRLLVYLSRAAAAGRINKNARIKSAAPACCGHFPTRLPLTGAPFGRRQDELSREKGPLARERRGALFMPPPGSI